MPGFYDEDGAYVFAEDDLAAPDSKFSSLLNKGLQSIKAVAKIPGPAGPRGLAGPAGAAGPAGPAGASVQIFEHGSNANMIRPATAGPVIWVGTVDPVGRINGDLWLTPTSAPTPEIPSGFIHRFEAVDITSADGTTATTWPNRVAGAPAFTATGGVIFQNTNGLKSFVFDGTNGRMDAAIATVPQAYTKLILARYVTAAASKVLVGGSSGSNNIASTSTSKISMTNGTTLSHTATVDTAWHLFTAVSDGASSQIWVDDVTLGGAAGASGQIELRLAANGGLTSFANVKIAAVFVYPRSLTPSEVAAVRAYAKVAYPGTIS